MYESKKYANWDEQLEFRVRIENSIYFFKYKNNLKNHKNNLILKIYSLPLIDFLVWKPILKRKTEASWTVVRAISSCSFVNCSPGGAVTYPDIYIFHRFLGVNTPYFRQVFIRKPKARNFFPGFHDAQSHSTNNNVNFNHFC